MPYDEELQIILFKHIKFYPYDKEVIFKRIKEWAALSFGSLKEVLHYEDYESGKIILKGYFNIPCTEDAKMWFYPNV